MKISEAKIRESFGHRGLSFEPPIFIYDTVGSTNDIARETCKKSNTGYTLIIADEQERGRGRLGRSFISKGGGGLYMSIIAPLKHNASDPALITAYTAVAVRRALFNLCGASAGIKWVNDIILGERKLGGILVEGVINPDTMLLNRCIVGIGINTHGYTLPPEIDAIATTLEREGHTILREELAAEIYMQFIKDFHLIATREIAKEYKSYSTVIDKAVRVIKPTASYHAHVVDITDKCELVLALPDGKSEILRTGEVSIREV